MARQQGLALLLKRGDGGSPEVFTTLCGFKDRSLNLSTSQIDTTAQDCNAALGVPVQETSAPGKQSRSFNVSGNFEDDVAGKATVDDARLGNVTNYQIIVPGYGTFEGPMFWTDFTLDGPIEGDMEFSGTLVAQSALTFT
jgi:predicted secreted protein